MCERPSPPHPGERGGVRTFQRFTLHACTGELLMSQSIEIKVPDIGDFKEIPVIEIMVKPGDRVSAEDPLVSLESDKATMEVPSPAAGTVRELKVKIGDKVSQGSEYGL